MNVIPVSLASSRPARRGLRAAFASAVFAVAASSAGAATLPAGFTETRVATGLSGPSAMEISPDGRIFICEEGGRLRVVKNNALLGTPFLTVTTNTDGERGLLGVAFDPSFSTNRYVYIYYTSTSGSIHNRVSRFRASASNPDVVEAGSEQVLLDLPPVGSAVFHNGGAIHFGPDGKLYIAVGDHKQNSASQSLNSTFGKILRINPDGSIPSDNPHYTATTGINRAIWARGLRNPFNFAFGAGRMLINDVGEGTWEEINNGQRGANYGWPTTEGRTSDTRFVSPLYVYESNNGPCSIIAGCFYTGTNFPSQYQGKYFFGDYCAGWIRYFNPANNSASGFATGLSSLVDTKMHPDGSLYYLQRGGGSLYRVRYSSGSTAPVINDQPDSLTRAVGQTASFSVSASGTAPLAYQWQRAASGSTTFSNISGATSATYSRTVASGDNGSRYRVVVTNSAGSATSSAATLTVSSGTAPVATISTPTSTTTFAGGSTISFSGSATDSQDGTLPGTSLTWWADLHHDTHTHPLMQPRTGTSGSFTFPAVNETSDNIWIRIYLRATDSSGLTHEVWREIQPRKSRVTIASSPSGLSLTLDGQPITTPYSFTGVEGIQRSLGAPSPRTLNGVNYNFQSWSDGGSQTHNISTPVNDTTYTATYTAGSAGAHAFEAESLTQAVSGATAANQSDTATSGGTWVALQADGVGDYIEFTTPSIPAGTYTVRLKYKSHPNRGILALRVDGTQIGGTLDQYAATAAYPERTFGTVTFSAAGTHKVRLTVTGKNAAAGNHTLSADVITFAP